MFVRAHAPRQHWHIKPTEQLIDTFQTLTTQIPVSPTYFFQKLLEDLDYQQFVQPTEDDERDEYRQTWMQAELQAKRLLSRFLQAQKKWNEFSLVDQILEKLPNNTILHLANSMPVRYANLIGTMHNVQVFANRGTSGIDGCTSTALGAALMTEQLVFVLTGDVAFFYDRNALWHPHIPANLRVVLFNNNGGNIFRLIDGPAAQPELEQYFETRHRTTAQHTTIDAQLDYFSLQEGDNFGEIWEQFINNDKRPKLLEIFTDPLVNAAVFEDFRKTD